MFCKRLCLHNNCPGGTISYMCCFELLNEQLSDSTIAWSSEISKPVIRIPDSIIKEQYFSSGNISVGEGEFLL